MFLYRTECLIIIGFTYFTDYSGCSGAYRMNGIL